MAHSFLRIFFLCLFLLSFGHLIYVYLYANTPLSWLHALRSESELNTPQSKCNCSQQIICITKDADRLYVLPDQEIAPKRSSSNISSLGIENPPNSSEQPPSPCSRPVSLLSDESWTAINAPPARPIQSGVHVIASSANASQFELVRHFVGSIHFYDPTRSILLFTQNFTDDQLAEIRLFVHVTVFTMRTDVPGIDADMLTASILKTAKRYHKHVVYVPLNYRLQKRLCKLDEMISRGKTAVLSPDCRQTITASDEECQPIVEYFHERDVGSPCWARMTNLSPSPSHPPLPREPGKKYWCMCIATYSKEVVQSVQALPLLSTFVRPFINTITPSLSRYNFAIYVGTQVDPNWDDLQRRQELVRELTTLLTPLNITLKVFRYSLNPGVRDITWKYNQLILQAHADGCDYLYQFSDDSRLEVPGWPDALAKFLDSQNGFGTVGMMDRRNPSIMTLGASGRAHIDINGFFWPPRLKNWYSDNYIQDVYGKMSKLFREYYYFNTQAQGQRYKECIHDRLYREEINRSRYRALAWLEKRRPSDVEYMRSLLQHGMDLTRELQPYPNTTPDPECPGLQESSFDTWENVAAFDLICGNMTHIC